MENENDTYQTSGRGAARDDLREPASEVAQAALTETTSIDAPPKPTATDGFERALGAVSKRMKAARPGSDIYLRLATIFDRLLKCFLQAQMGNYYRLTKDRMLRNWIWRGRVLAALGGETALFKWENRKRRADMRRNNPHLWLLDYEPNKKRAERLPKAPKPAVDYSDIYELDREIFRLARIEEGRSPYVIYKLPEPAGYREPPALVTFRRIELTPEDLRDGLPDLGRDAFEEMGKPGPAQMQSEIIRSATFWQGELLMAQALGAISELAGAAKPQTDHAVPQAMDAYSGTHEPPT